MSTGKLRFLTLVKPVLCVLPEVAQPDRKIPFKARRPHRATPAAAPRCRLPERAAAQAPAVLPPRAPTRPARRDACRACTAASTSIQKGASRV